MPDKIISDLRFLADHRIVQGCSPLVVASIDRHVQRNEPAHRLQLPGQRRPVQWRASIVFPGDGIRAPVQQQIGDPFRVASLFELEEIACQVQRRSTKPIHFIDLRSRSQQRVDRAQGT
jgi:hypothetical protein